MHKLLAATALLGLLSSAPAVFALTQADGED